MYFNLFSDMMKGSWGAKQWQNHHSEQQQLSTKNNESHQKRLILVDSDVRFLRWKVWYDLFPSIDSSCQGLSDWPEIQQTNSENLVQSLQDFSIKSFIIWNYTKHEKQHETRKLGIQERWPFHWFKTNKCSRNWKLSIHNIIPNWNPSNHHKNRKEKLQCTSTSFQIMMRGIWGVKDWQNHHSKQKQPSTKIIESHQTRLRLVGSDARQRPTFLEREVLIWLASINRKFWSGTLAMARDSTTEFRNLGGKSSGV